jgi:signal transduction histidine kinase/ActR/RegA family two-component response regulator
MTTRMSAQTPEAPIAEHSVERRVLVAAPGPRDAAVLCRAMAEASIEAVVCHSLDDLCVEIERGAGAAVVAEEGLDPRARTRLSRVLSRQPDWSDFPLIIMMAAAGASRDRGWRLRKEVSGPGHAIVLERPVTRLTLLSAIEAALQSRMRQYQVRDELERRHRAEAALREADRRKDEFIAILAHELRNPLAPIRAGLDLLKMTGADRLEQVRDMLDRQTLQLIRLVDDLLHVSRIASGALELRRSLVTVTDVVQGAVEASQPLVSQAGHELIVDLPAEDIVLDGDPHRLTQILSNLLNNAAKYTPRGGCIRVSAEPQQDEIAIVVRDSGIGIPAEMREAIFEMFAQVRHPSEPGHAGLGIGLTLARSLVHLHGGRIEVHSEGAGRGAEFRVRLPLTVAAADAGAAGPPGVAAASSGRHRVLIVDDNRAAVEMLSRVVALLGQDVRTAGDGDEAVQVAAAFRPHIVLMDIGMPTMNGLEAARLIRAQPWGRSMRLVALTGWGQAGDRRRTREAGFDHHVVKPARMSDLRRVLAELEERDLQPDREVSS